MNFIEAMKYAAQDEAVARKPNWEKYHEAYVIKPNKKVYTIISHYLDDGYTIFEPEYSGFENILYEDVIADDWAIVLNDVSKIRFKEI